MVQLMLQPVFVGLVRGAEDYRMTSDDLYQMWAVSTSAKTAMVQGRRLENLSWRLWYTSTIRGRMQSELAHAHASTPSSSNSANGAESIIPPGRALFASTCTSILAEIQDASIRQASRPFSFGIPFPTASAHASDFPASPPQRARSPGPSEHRKKKNVDKFLKKFRTNLEDISELFDERSGKDGEPEEDFDVDVDVTDEQAEHPEHQQTPSSQTAQFSQSPDFAAHSLSAASKSSEKPRTHKSILSKLIQRSSLPASPLTAAAEIPSNAVPAAVPEPKPAASTFLNSSDSFINSQLELLALGRYDRRALSPQLQRARSITPQPVSTTACIRTAKINTANPESSISGDSAEDSSYDSQLIIW
jgi:hypothetical protein